MEIICPDFELRKKIGLNLESSVFENKSQIESFVDNSTFAISPFAHIYEKEGKFLIFHSLSLKKIYGEKILLDFFNKFKQQDWFTKTTLLSSGLRPVELDILLNEHLIIRTNSEPIFWNTKCPRETFSNWNLIFDKLHLFLSNQIPLWDSKPLKQTNLSLELGKEALQFFLQKLATPACHPKIIFYTDNSNLNWKTFTNLIEILKKRIFKNKNVILALLLPVETLNADKINFLKRNIINTSIYLPLEFEKWEKLLNILKLSQKKLGELAEFVWNTRPFNNNLKRRVLKFFSKKLMAKNLRLNLIQGSYKKFSGDKKANLYLKLFKNCLKSNMKETLILNNYKVFFEEKSILNLSPNYPIQVVINSNGEVGLCRPLTLKSKFLLGKLPALNNKDIFQNPLLKTLKNKIPIFQDECKSCVAIGLCRGGCLAKTYKKKKDSSKLDAQHCKFMKKMVGHFLYEFIRTI